MKISTIFLSFLFLLTSCHESLEQRAEREAREYTEKYCPTPIVNFVRTDSIAFDKTTLTYKYYCTFSNKMDNIQLVKQNENQLRTALLTALRENTNIKVYKEAGYKFSYTMYSQKHPSEMLFTTTFGPKDYK